MQSGTSGGSLFSGGEDTVIASTLTTSSVGNSNPIELMPPYYALAYIMKLSA